MNREPDRFSVRVRFGGFVDLENHGRSSATLDEELLEELDDMLGAVLPFPNVFRDHDVRLAFEAEVENADLRKLRSFLAELQHIDGAGAAGQHVGGSVAPLAEAAYGKIGNVDVVPVSPGNGGGEVQRRVFLVEVQNRFGHEFLPSGFCL